MQTKDHIKHQIGIDEVGRGPLAGPVAVGVCFIAKSSKATNELARQKNFTQTFRGVKESKQLSEADRERWFAIMKKARAAGIIDFHVSFRSQKTIDKCGLTHAINASLCESLEKIILKNKINADDCEVLLDGGLHAPAYFKYQKTIIRGDEKKTIIALASICAKVLRDRRMRAYAKKYPQYGFDVHKGYGTLAHRQAISTYGPCVLHRRSFLKSILIF